MSKTSSISISKKLSLCACAFLLVITSLPLQPVSAGEPDPAAAGAAPKGITTEEFYRESNITFFGEDIAACGPGSSPPGATAGSSGSFDVSGGPAKTAFDFFVSQGFPPFMAAGIVGNLIVESAGLDADVTNHIGAYGLAQWLGDRKTGLQTFADGKGKPRSDFVTQLEYIVHEFNNKEKAAGDAIRATTEIGQPNYIPNQTTGTVGVMMDKYERPSAAERRQSYDERIGYAKRVLEVHGNGAPSSGAPAPTAGGGTAPGSSAPGGAGAPGGVCPTAGGNFTGAPGQTKPQGKGFTLQENTDYAGTPCAPGSAESRTYRHPVVGFQIKLCKVGAIEIASIVSDRVVSMVNDAKAAGITLTGGGFRDYETQLSIYNGRGCPCNPPVAKPGTSQHERGLAIDFSADGYYNLPSESWHWSPSGN